MALMADQNQRFPDDPAVYEWALLKNANAYDAKKLADIIQKNSRMILEQMLSVRLRPAGAAEALETYWLIQICGKPAKGASAVHKVEELGIPFPPQK